MAYKQKKIISHSSGSWKSEIRVPTKSSSGEGSLSVSQFSCSVQSSSVANQAPLSIEFSRQDWSGLPFPSLGYLPDPGIEPRSPVLLADALPSDPSGKQCGDSKSSAIVRGCGQLMIPCSFTDIF